MHGAAGADAAQHDAGARSGGAGGCGGARAKVGDGAAGAGAVAVSDGAAARRAGVCARLVGRGAVDGGRAGGGGRAVANGLLSDFARADERVVLCRAEGRAVFRHEQCGQFGAHLPRALDGRDEAVDRRGGLDGLVQGLDRHGPARLLRQQHAEQSAGDDEVHLLREAAGNAGGGDQSVPRAGAGAILGAVGGGERALRDEDRGRVLSGAHGRGPGLHCGRAASSDRAGMDG